MKNFILLPLIYLASVAICKEGSDPLEMLSLLPPPGPDGLIPLMSRTRAGVGYTISNFSTTFWNSLDYCKATGRHLLAIEDIQEQIVVSRLLENYGVDTLNAWTSGVELWDNYLIWASTGEEIGFTNIGNSNDDGMKTCLSIHGTCPYKNQWIYTACQQHLPFICEYSIPDVSTTYSPTSSGGSTERTTDSDDVTAFTKVPLVST